MNDLISFLFTIHKPSNVQAFYVEKDISELNPIGNF